MNQKLIGGYDQLRDALASKKILQSIKERVIERARGPYIVLYPYQQPVDLHTVVRLLARKRRVHFVPMAGRM